MGRPPDAVQTIPRRTVEALFHADGLVPTEPMRGELRAMGVDLDGLGPWYSVTVFRGILDVVRRHAFGDAPEEDGFRAVGRRWVAGFKHTPIGWVFRAMAPIFGVDRTLQTLPRYLTLVREDVPLTVVATGERRYQLTCPDVSANAHFLAGCLEALLETCGCRTGLVAVTSAGPQGHVIDVSWT